MSEMDPLPENSLKNPTQNLSLDDVYTPEALEVLPQPAEALLKNPYVGPRPFETRERQLFFGRDWEAEELVALIVAHPAVLLYARSGAGKSSLLNARIVPKLRDEEGCEVLPVARVRGDIPEGIRTEQIENLYVFNALLNWTEATVVTPAQLVNLSLAQLLGRLPHQSDHEGYPALRVIVFDQFEELFTFYPERWPEREKFLIQVNEALVADSLLRVLFVIREDYLAQLDPHLHLLPEQLRYRFRLERLRQEAALAAVVGPLRGTGRSFAPGVAEALVAELLKIRVEGRTGETVEAQGEFVEPVQLQVVCQSLWNDLPPEVLEITESQLLAFGNVDQALTKFYERAVQNAVQRIKLTSSLAQMVPVYTQWQLRNWFERDLITPAGTRGLVYRGAKTTGGVPNIAIETLESHHLIRGEQRAGARWYELTHDRFIRPIQHSNENWRRSLLRRGGIVVASLVGLIMMLLIAVTTWFGTANPSEYVATITAAAMAAETAQAAAAVTATAATYVEATGLAAENEAAQVISAATADIAQVTVVAASAQQATAEMAAEAVEDSLPTNIDALPADASTAIAATQVIATEIAATQQAAQAEATAAAALALLTQANATATAAAAEGFPNTADIIAAQETAQANATTVAVAATSTSSAIEAGATATAAAALAATAAAESATATAAAMPTPTPTPTATATPTPIVTTTAEPTATLTPTSTPKPAVAWPPRDWIVFTSARLSPADLYLMNGDGSNVVRLTANIAYDPGYSRVSNRLVFASTREKRAVLFTINPDGSDERNVGGFEWDNWEPTFAPDGRRIAFVSSRDGEADIYSIRVDSSGLQRLTDDPTKDYAPAWSPDGRRIAFVSDRSSQADIWLMDTDGGNLVQLTNNRAQDVNPAWSPDGSQLVFASDRDGNADIFVMDADGSNQRNLTRSQFPENYPAWSLNSNWLTFSRFTVNNEIFIMTVDGKCPAELPQSEIVEITQDGNCLVNLTKSSDADWSPIWLPRSIFSR